VKKSFNIQELLHPKPKCHGTKAHGPLLPPKTPKTQFEASQLMDLIATKQNKLSSFIDRCTGQGCMSVEPLQFLPGRLGGMD